jgi:hypothetical protein
MVSSSKMLHSLALALALILGPAGLTACGGGDGDPVAEGCDRLDECNALNAGISADECVEMVDTQLENVTPSQRSDWETLMGGCLEFDTCSAFLSCVNANDL